MEEKHKKLPFGTFFWLNLEKVHFLNDVQQEIDCMPFSTFWFSITVLQLNF